MNKFFYLLITILLFLNVSCKREQFHPSYLKIDSVGLISDYSISGTTSNKITDVWVYANDNVIGCFELPARVPILASGNTKITLMAGIKVNGISATRASYPFYKDKIYNIELKEDSTFFINPIFSIDSNAVITLFEDFEGAGIKFEKTALSDTNITNTNDPQNVFKNYQNLSEISNYSGLVYVNSTKSKFEIQTVDNYVMPKNGNYVFLEMNYKCTSPILVGLFANYSTYSVKNPILVLNPSEKWNKIYINLTIAISRESDAQNFKFYFYGIKKDEHIEDYFYFDNIKLIRAKY